MEIKPQALQFKYKRRHYLITEEDFTDKDDLPVDHFISPRQFFGT